MSNYFLVLVNTIGAMAICALLYGMMQQRMRSAILRRAGIGLVLGCGGIVVMSQPIILDHGIQADARGAFIGMAAAFGGPIAAVIAVALTVTARILIGGSGFIVGSFVIAVNAVAALMWRYHVGNTRKHTWTAWLLICIACIFPTVCGLFTVTGAVTPTSVFLSIVISLVVIIFGKMLEAEQRRGRRERELTREASTDCLTSLPNRRALERYSQHLEQEKATGVLFLLIDVDHFKKINDEYGHNVGDDVLRNIGSIIRSTVRDTDFAARIGGEEFAIIVRTRSSQTGRLVADRFRTALRVPFGINQQTYVSVGGFFFDREPFTYSKGYDCADQALYASKAMGRNRVTFYQVRNHEINLAA